MIRKSWEVRPLTIQTPSPITLRLWFVLKIKYPVLKDSTILKYFTQTPQPTRPEHREHGDSIQCLQMFFAVFTGRSAAPTNSLSGRPITSSLHPAPVNR